MFQRAQQFVYENDCTFSELCEAATKIQATFRGHKQRKQTEEDKLSSEMEKAKVQTSKF